MRTIKTWCIIFMATFAVFSQVVTDPLPYAEIANPLPDTMDQLYRDSVNLVFSPIRINQAGYRPQDEKYFYYVGSSASSFSVIDQSGETVGNGTLRPTEYTTSGQLSIRASNNAQLVSGGDTRYTMSSPQYSGPISEGLIPDLPAGAYHVVVNQDTSAKFVINERVYSWVRDALLKFYGVNRCGDSESWFHPPCHLEDAVTGGWHDCGDHLKEGATMSYTAAVLGLAAAAFSDRDADVYRANQGITQTTDGIPDMLYEAKHGADFVLQSYEKAGGQVGEMITSVGGFGEDHNWWGRPENQDLMPEVRGGPPRSARNEATSDFLGKYAACLAFVSRLYQPYDQAYADRCLEAAEAIYDYTLPRLDNTNTPAYSGATIVTDDVAFGAVALLWATGERKYLDDLCYDQTIGEKAQPENEAPLLFRGGLFTNNDPLFTKTTANTDWASTQTHVLWGFFKLVLENQALCESLGVTEQERLGLIEKTMVNLMANLSSVGMGTQVIDLPPGVLWVPSMVKYELPWFTMHTQMEWVWNRYQAGNITDMYYYYDMASRIQGMELPHTPASTDWKAPEVKTILVRMLDYMLGVNPWDISTIYGVGAKNYNHPHHRAANPEGKNVPGAFYRYFPPVGALQGGYMPRGGENHYEEHYDEYHKSETGIDGTTNILMPVVGLSKRIDIGPPSGTVKTVYVGCDRAIIEVRQSKFGTAEVYYGEEGGGSTAARSDSSGISHRFVLEGLSSGTTYNYNVVVTDAFGRDSTLKYVDHDKNLVDFSFTTPTDCPTNAQIRNVKVCKVTSDSAEIFWYTPNGEFDSRVVFGEQQPPDRVHDGDIAGNPVKFHYVKIGDLKEKTTYYFYVESGDSRDDNNGQYYSFTTPVEFVKFDVRTLRYDWGEQPGVGVNIINQDSKAYDSLELRLYFRDKEGFEKDLGARIDILVLYREDGFQDTVSGALRDAIWANLATQKPQIMPDTYDPADSTYAYYLTIPLWDVQMRSQSRIRMDIIFDHWEQERLQDLMGEAPEHEINDRDWSFGPHSKADGDPIDYPGVPVLPKNEVDHSYWDQPINHYVTIYRKDEYVWGYSPSQQERQTKKTQYRMNSQVLTPLTNPTADYVFIARSVRSIDVTGWFTIEPVDGELNDIWVNGVEQSDIASMYAWSEADQRYNFTIPVPVQNGRNDVDITLFAGPALSCEECYGCAVTNHSFYVEFQGAKQYPSTLTLMDAGWQELVGDSAKPDTTQFHVEVSDQNGNLRGDAKDSLYVSITNPVLGDTLDVLLIETGDSTGVFRTHSMIKTVNLAANRTGPSEIGMRDGDKIWITYTDPSDPTDVSEKVLVSKARFPVALRGVLRDSNGDGAVDQLDVEYSMPLETVPDSLQFSFPGASDTRMVPRREDVIEITGDGWITVSLAPSLAEGTTGFSSGSSSQGISYITHQGDVRMSAFDIADGAGPVLVETAVLYERTDNPARQRDDTLQLTFSENINPSTILSDTLILHKNDRRHLLYVKGAIGAQSAADSMRLIVTGNVDIAMGDSISLYPYGRIADEHGNGPHEHNRPVPIRLKLAPPRIEAAWYSDSDYNGIIDRIDVVFSKEVVREEIRASFRWAGSEQTANRIQYGSDQTRLRIAIEDLVDNREPNTGGNMSLVLGLASFPQQRISCEVADSAAPVIVSADFLPSASMSGEFVDTLRVKFSETVDAVSARRPFNLYSTSEHTGYSFVLENAYHADVTMQTFLVHAIEGTDFPGNNDTIWIASEALVRDANNVTQKSEDNRRVGLRVRPMPFYLNVNVWPNPLKGVTDYPADDGNAPAEMSGKAGMLIRITPVARIITRVKLSGTVKIYDPVGNVVKRGDMQNARTSSSNLYFHWDGRNEQNRYVGAGTFMAVLNIVDEESGEQIVEKLPLGIKAQ